MPSGAGGESAAAHAAQGAAPQPPSRAEAATPAAPAARRPPWSVATVCGGTIAALGFGIGTSFGLFVEPICTDVGFGREVVSLAVGVSMLINGTSSILWGWVGDRLGFVAVAWAFALLMCGALVFTSFGRSEAVFYVSIPLIGLADAAIAPGTVLGAIGKLYSGDDAASERARGNSSALQSCGAVFIPPVVGAVLAALDHWRDAMRVVASFALLCVPLSVPFFGAQHSTPGAGGQMRSGSTPASTEAASKSVAECAAPAAPDATLRETVRVGLTSRSFVLLVAGFFACGFHVLFVNTHLAAHTQDLGMEAWVAPAALACIGVGNIAGTFAAGALGARWPRRKSRVLAGIYLGRAVLFALFALLPPSEYVVIGFSVLLGVLYLSTVPLTAGLVVDMVGLQYNSTMFGFTFASHQLGSFFGAWLGGRLYDEHGTYMLMWWLCAGVGALAALLHWPITPDRLAFAAAPAAAGSPAPGGPPPGRRRDSGASLCAASAPASSAPSVYEAGELQRVGPAQP